MKTLGLQGIVRAEGIRTTVAAKDSNRAGGLLDRDFTAAEPNRIWVMDYTYVHCWTGFVYVAFIVDVFAREIVAWNAAKTKTVELVITPPRIALWQRDCEGHRPVPGELICQSYPHQGLPRHRTIADIEYATVGWFDWYNNRRLHGSFAMMTPMEFEDAHNATLNREPHPIWKRHQTPGDSVKT